MRRFLREPLVHFLAIGAALFFFFSWRGGGASGRIVVTRARLESFVAGFERTWRRPPTEQELTGLIDGFVREEAAVREAMATGLDRDDTIIRRRLKQKIDFLAEDRIDSSPPSEADLAAFLAAHAGDYRVEERIAFRQVCLRPDRHGGLAGAEAEARRLASRLARRAAVADPGGDSPLLPPDMPLAPKAEIARVFGSEFADAVAGLPEGRWSAPVRSGFGVHVVFVTAKTPARTPALADVRAAVERDFTADRRSKELDALYGRLLARTKVVVETSAPPETK